MAKPTLKDLRTTYSVLTKLTDGVPQPLLVRLAAMIRAEEQSRQYRKLARMTEEDLIRYQAHEPRRLRINLPDGRIVQEKTNEQTFYSALRELDFGAVVSLDLRMHGNPIFVAFATPRKQYNGYKALRESCFVLRSLRPDERVSLLQRLDEALCLGWEISKM